MVVRRAPEPGMTLVELMVTMVIASIVAASTFMFFAGQQRVYETQTKMLNVQQNAWAAMEVLTRFVRASGSGMYGCVRPVGGIVPAPPLTRTPDATPDDSDDPPALPNVHGLSQVPNAGLRANSGGTMQRIPPLWIVDQADPTQTNTAGIKAQTDVITVAFGNRASGTTCDASLSTNINVNNVPSSITTAGGYGVTFQANEFILLVSNPNTASGFLSDIGCTLFQISSVSVDNLLLASTKPWNPASNVPSMIPFTYLAAGCAPSPPSGPVSNAGIRNLGEFWWVRFAVRTTDQNGNYLSNQGIPVLTMERLDGSDPNGPQVLAEGIEDLQVAFACDLNADGLLSEGQGAGRATDEWTLNSPNDVIAMNRAAKCNQPSAIRITLVARSLTEDNGIDANQNFNGPPTVENHVRATCCGDPSDPSTTKPATCCDQYRRRVLSTTVYPRNN